MRFELTFGDLGLNYNQPSETEKSSSFDESKSTSESKAPSKA